MSTEIILPAKRRVDVHGIIVPFEQLLQAGESISVADCSVKVFSGIDLNPSEMLLSDAQIRGTSIYQQIRLGQPGVIYKLIFSAETDKDNTYYVEATLAVLEDSIPPGPIYQYLDLSSTPYPIDVLEAMASEGFGVSGREWIWPIEGINSVGSIIEGSIRVILLDYTMLSEGIDSSGEIVSGTLDQILLQYSIPPEGVSSNAGIIRGYLYGIRINYTNWPAEGINSAAEIISGTLT